MMRLFVGIGVPEGLAIRLGILQTGQPGARWVAPESLHLTLRFIGEVERNDA
jgi:2'-5' RNA ligase